MGPAEATGTSSADGLYAARGGLEGTRRLLRRRSGGAVTRDELARARQNAEDVGRQGEELILGYCTFRKESGDIDDFEWTASTNAISPYDFRIKNCGWSKVDVKSTKGEFDRVLHISLAELLEMRDGGEPYNLYRVYELTADGGTLRIAENVADFADQIIRTLEQLPSGVNCDSVSVKPSSLAFGAEILIDAGSFSTPAEDREDDES